VQNFNLFKDAKKVNKGGAVNLSPFPWIRYWSYLSSRWSDSVRIWF